MYREKEPPMPILQERMISVIEDGLKWRAYAEALRRRVNEIIGAKYERPEQVGEALLALHDSYPPPETLALMIEAHYFKRMKARNDKARAKMAKRREVSTPGRKFEVEKDFGPTPEDLAEGLPPAVHPALARIADGIILGEDGQPVSEETLAKWRAAEEEIMSGFKRSEK